MEFDGLVITYVFFVASFWLGALTQFGCTKFKLPCKRPLLILAIVLIIYMSGRESHPVALPNNSEITMSATFAFLWTIVVAATFLWAGFVAQWRRIIKNKNNTPIKEDIKNVKIKTLPIVFECHDCGEQIEEDLAGFPMQDPTSYQKIKNLLDERGWKLNRDKAFCPTCREKH